MGEEADVGGGRGVNTLEHGGAGTHVRWGVSCNSSRTCVETYTHNTHTTQHILKHTHTPLPPPPPLSPPALLPAYHSNGLLGVRIDSQVTEDLLRDRYPPLVAKIEDLGQTIQYFTNKW